MQEMISLLRIPEGELWLSNRLIRLAETEKKAVVRNNFPQFDLDFNTEIDWGANPHNNVTWQLYFCSMGWLAPCAKLGHAHPEYGVYAKEVVLSACTYALAHDRTHNKGYWNDHAVAYRGSYIAYVYAEILHDILSKDEETLLFEAMRKHEEVLVDFLESDKWLLSNHTLFHAEGLADILVAFEKDPDERMRKLEQVALYVRDFANRVITTKEGSVKEHAVFYHAFLMGRLKLTSEFLARLGITRKAVTDRTYRKMKAFLFHIMPRDGYLPGIGDSKHEQKFDRKYLGAFRGQKFDTPETDMFRPKERDSDFNTSAPYYLGEYPTDGFYVSRSYNDPELYSLFLHKEFKGPHGHWDALSFVSYHKGAPVFIDSGGPFKYGEQMRFRYFQTQLAHNTLLVEGTPSQYHSQMLVVDGDQDSTVLVGGARLLDNLIWVRCFMQIADLCHIVVDWPISQGDFDGSVVSRFHLDPGLDFDIEDGTLNLSREGDFVARMDSTLYDAPLAEPTQILADLAHLTFELKKPLRADKLKALPENFEKRAFVTYKDNERIDGKLADMPATVDQLNLRVVQYDKNSVVSHSLEGAVLQVVVQGTDYKKSVSVDFAQMKVSQRITQHG